MAKQFGKLNEWTNMSSPIVMTYPVKQSKTALPLAFYRTWSDEKQENGLVSQSIKESKF